MTYSEGLPSSEGKIEALRDKIREWIREESANDPDVQHINLDDLMLGDIAIARQIDTHEITGSDWDKYTLDLTKELQDAPKDIQKSRGLFHRVAGNRANAVIGEKLLEDSDAHQ